jgi:hypothetical protein
MCRNIRVLHDFEPPTTADEIHAAAVQYIRKVSGATSPTKRDAEAFARAVEQVARATSELLTALAPRATRRTRESERERAKAAWDRRAKRIAGP